MAFTTLSPGQRIVGSNTREAELIDPTREHER
jgi:hypothetical protein